MPLNIATQHSNNPNYNDHSDHDLQFRVINYEVSILYWSNDRTGLHLLK